MLRWLLLPSLVLLIVVLVTPPAADAADDAKERILKLFVDEFIEVTPGVGKFPASFTMGSADGPPVGKKKPNAWGFYDMHGYVWEWCADAWSPTLEGTPANGTPRQLDDAKEHVLRGGSWADDADKARSAFRHHKPPDFRSDAI